MEKKHRFPWIKEIKKLLKDNNIPEIQLDDNLLNDIEKKINDKNSPDFEENIQKIAKGIKCVGIIKIINNKLSINGISDNKLPFFNQSTRDLEDGDIIDCTLEYTLISKSFNISNFKKIEINKELIIEHIYRELNEKSFFKKIDYILELLGLNSNKLMFREKITYIIRLIPLVVELYSLIELSKGSLGKTTTYKNFGSCYIADSSETPATLIYNQSTNTPGLITSYNTLVLDEIQKIKKDEILNNIQKFLEDGKLPRQSGLKNSYSTSIVLLGNAKLDSNLDYPDLFLTPYESLFKNHPTIHNELIDRINFILPSWSNRAFSQSNIHKDNNIFLLSLFFNSLRKSHITQDQKNILDDLCDEYNLNSLSIRASSSISKTTEGFIKILNLTTEKDIEFALFLSTEGRFLTDFMNRDHTNLDENIDIYKDILNDDLYEDIIIDYLDSLNIPYERIIDFTPHEVFFKSEDKGYITFIALDTVGLKEINLLKKYSKKSKSTNDFILPLKCNSSYDLKKFYKDLIDDIDQKSETIDFREDSKNYLYGYDLENTLDFCLLRNLAHDDNLPCCEKCGRYSFYINKDDYLKCKKCGEIYSSVKESFKYLRFL